MTSEATHTPARLAPARIPHKGGGPFMDFILDLVELLGKAGW